MKAKPKDIKTLLCFSLMVLFSAMAFGQTPDAVKQKFDEMFPGAKSVKWPEPEAENEHDAEFRWKKTNMVAQFDSEGNWLETETEMDADEMPAAVLLAIKVGYPEHELDPDVVMLSTPERDKAYEVLLENDGEVWKVVFTAGGRELEKGKEEG